MTEQDILNYVNGKITIEELFSKSSNPAQLLKEFNLEKQKISNRRLSDLEILTKLHAGHNRGAQNITDIFVSTTNNPYIAANNFTTKTDEDVNLAGLSGVMILEIPESSAFDIEQFYNLGDYEGEYLIPGEIKREWIVGFIPANMQSNDLVFDEQLNKFNSLASFINSKASTIADDLLGKINNQSSLQTP